MERIIRIYVCNNCNTKLDRDLNASLNLRNYYITTTPKSGESKASRVGSSLDENQDSLTVKEEITLLKGEV
jgi:transposase